MRCRLLLAAVALASCAAHEERASPASYPGPGYVATAPLSPPAPPPAVTPPDDEPPTPYLRDVRQLSVGTAHVCALTAALHVVCWGDNAAGQLGVDTNGRSLPGTVTRPHRVGGLPDVVQIAAGHMHTCALTRDGAVFCWGSAGGDLHITEGGVSGSVELHGPALGTPVRMALGSGAARLLALSSREDAACAAFDEDVRCWSTFGALPIDPAANAPPLVGTTTPLPGVTALALGHGAVCAIARGGALWCWSGGAKNKPAQPVLAARARSDRAPPGRVAIGEQAACVANLGGELRCWPSLIGDFWTKPPAIDVRWPRRTPTLVVAVGDSPICTVDRDGRVDCFLANEAGLPDQAAARSWAGKAMAPHPIAGIDLAADLGLGTGRNAFGYGFGCALRAAADAAGAQVLCWGDNDSGQLGTGDTVTSTRTAVRVLGAR